MDMVEVGYMGMEWINLVQGAGLSQAFVDMGDSQSVSQVVSPSVSQSVKKFATYCRLLYTKIQTKKISKQNLNRLSLEV
jgi:hypothetical protein